MVFRFTIIFAFLILGYTHLFAQSITPSVINNGGGWTANMEWSMGESVSIDHYMGPSILLNTGVLQPYSTVVTSINENGLTVFGNEIIVGPNPTINKLAIRARFRQLGNMSIQLLDSKSSNIQTYETIFGINSYDKEITMENYPAGLYYVRVVFKSIYGEFKTGIYKIIKL